MIKNNKDKKLTPVMQQYVDIKSENPDALVLFRLGDFYEVFFDDAKTVSQTIGIVLTARGTDENGRDIPMCGIPWHAADGYFGRLVNAGFRVALVEQMETPDQARARGAKYVERKVVRVLTPGTLTDENLLSPKKSNFLVAVCPDGDMFNIAGCDISTGEFFVGTSQTVHDDMARINPAEIIYPEMFAEHADVVRLRGDFDTTPVYEKLYDRDDIGQIVSKIFGNSLDKSEIKNAKFAISDCAVALLAGYLFNTQRGVNIAFRAPYEFGRGKQLLIDSATWKSLEIDTAIAPGGACLMDVLDKTRTSSGARRLRGYIRTLSSDIGEIRRRNEHVGHLILNRDIMGRLSQLLMRVPDIERALSRLLLGRGTPRDMRVSVDFMILLGEIKLVGAKLDSSLSVRFAQLDTNDILAAELKFALADELPTFFRDGHVIRDGFDPALDNMRNLANGARDTIAGLQSEYANATKIPTLKIKYNNILGYFIEIPATKSDIMMAPGSGFIHRQTMAGNMRFTTSKLVDLDNAVRSAGEKAFGIESEIIGRFIEKIRDVSDDLLGASELISDADVWCALADVAIDYEWTRPVMTTKNEFDIVGGRHPVIDAVLRKTGDKFVRNDCNLNINPVALLTGPNMAGKSTYLRQNALIVALAHLGSFVPAEHATIGIADQLFSRVGASDNLAAGQSTFMVEMTETANILNRMTDKSFVIFDEIGRGTATYDGMAIAQAVLEFLDNIHSRCLFATHYHELTALVGDILHRTQCLTIDIREHNNEIIFMHKIVPGVANRSYGLHVAKMAGIKSEVVARAETILEELEGRVEIKDKRAESKEQMPENKVCEPKSGAQLSLFG